jgi:Tetraspanin family
MPGNRARDVTHGIVSSFMILVGLGLLVFGIYLERKDKIVIDKLDFPGSEKFNRLALDFGVGSLIIGGFFVLLGIVGFIALFKRLLGKAFRFILFTGLLVSLALLSFVIFLSSKLVTGRKEGSPIQGFIQSGFENTVASSKPERICALEKQETCRGFLNNDCANCKLGTEVACSFGTPLLRCAKCKNQQADPAKGCSEAIYDNSNRFYLPVFISSSVLAAVVIFDLVLVCAL